MNVIERHRYVWQLVPIEMSTISNRYFYTMGSNGYWHWRGVNGIYPY